MKLSIVTEAVIAKMYAKSKHDCKKAAKSKKSGRTKK
jgi:hypothetical protein